MREVRTFRVGSESVDATLAKFHKIAGRGKSKGLEGGFKVLGITNETIKDSDGVEYEYTAIEVECEPVKFAGWEFLAVAEIEQGVVLTRGIGSAQEVKPSEVKVGYCAHCGTTRQRRKYIFVKNESGEVKQVGSTCVKDFLGWEFTPTYLQSWAEFEAYAKPTAPSGVSTVAIAAVALAVVAKDGYKSSTQYGYENSTARTVHEMFLFGSRDAYSTSQKRHYGVEKLSEEQLAAGRELIDFAKTFKGESAYAENLRAVAALPYQTGKTVGIFVSAIIAKQKAQEQEVAKKSASKVYKSEQFAETGKRVEIEVTVLAKREIETQFGFSTLWTFESGEYKFKWFDSGYSFGAEIGEQFKIKGTIKGLDEYQGQYATKLSRVARVKELVAS